MAEPTIAKIIRYIEKVIYDAMLSEKREGEVKYVLMSLKEETTNGPKYNQIMLYYVCPFKKVANKIHYRIQKNFQKNFGIPISWTCNHNYCNGGELSIMKYDRSCLYDIASTMIMWAQTSKFGIPLLIEQRSLPSPEHLRRYLLPNRYLGIKEVIFVTAAEDYYKKQLSGNSRYTHEQGWPAYCNTYRFMTGQDPKAINEFHVEAESVCKVTLSGNNPSE